MSLSHNLSHELAKLANQVEVAQPNLIPELMESLDDLFCKFLETVHSSEWSRSEHALVKKVILLDLANQCFLTKVSQESLIYIVSNSYVDPGVRMFMLSKVRHVIDKKSREKILISFFEADPSETIRETALVSLASENWEPTLHHAKALWKSEDTIKRIVALKVFGIVDPGENERCLELALNSQDESLRIYAESIKKTT